MIRKLLCAQLLGVLLLTPAYGDDLLKGTVIGTIETVNYNNSADRTNTVNTRENAFDGDLSTFFASYDKSYTWAGLDLGEAHVITRVGWSPRNASVGEDRVLLGVFEGANRADFMDALPLYIIPEKGKIGTMSYADVECSKGFRYVRYIGPTEARCNIAELEFYGHPGAGDNSHLCQLTNLPTVSIHTLNNEIPYDKEHQIESQLMIISNDGTRLLSEPGTTRERGNGSRTFPKKPWRIKFDKKQSVLDAPAKAKKWTLLNNYSDKTLFRNLLAFELSRQMGIPYTPYGTAVDVLMNGEYKGCYQLCDQVEINTNRVNITEMTPDDNQGSALTGGYLIELDAYANQEVSWFKSGKGNPVTIKSPDEDEITANQKQYITNFFNQMEKQWATYLDVNSFLRHFLVGELSGNTDTYWSVFMYKERDEDLLHVGPVWDFDLAFENDNRTYPINKKTKYVYQDGGSCAGNMRTFVNNIVNDASAGSQLLAIWGEARQAGLNEENLFAFIDRWAAELEQSQRLNFLRWPVMNQKVQKNPVVWGSYKAEVDNVKNFLKERLVWMDKKLGYTYHPSGVSTLRLDKTQPYQVFSLSGQSCGNSVEFLSSGVYIVRQGTMTQKIVVK